MRWIAALAVGCFVWHGGSDLALADPRPEAATGRRQAKSEHDPAARARASYLDGVGAYRAGRFREAILAFSRADALVPSAALSFDIARACDRLHDGPSAVRWYRDYLRRSGGAAPDRRQIERRIAQLTAASRPATPQRLSVATHPEGALLRLDGARMGSTPWSGMLEPGMHRLELERSGYASFTQAVWVAHDNGLDVRVALSEKKVPETNGSAASIREKELAPGSLPDARPEERAKASDRGALKTTGYVVAGFGGAAVAGGVVFELLRRSSGNEGATASPGTNGPVADTAAERQEIAARVLVASGATLLATGGVLLVLGSRTVEQRPQVVAGCLPGGCAASFRGKF